MKICVAYMMYVLYFALNRSNDGDAEHYNTGPDYSGWVLPATS